MTRLIKFWTLAGLTSVYLMQGVCTRTGDGVHFNFLPNLWNLFGLST